MTLSRKTPLARGRGPERRTRLRAFSDKREADRPERRAVVAAVLERDRYRCQAHDLLEARGISIDGFPRCRGPLDPHEVIPRSAWSGGYLVESNVLTVCRASHQWIGDHPEAAHSFGWHGFSYERPS